MVIGDLFSGIGGFSLAGRWLGWRTAWFSEIDPYAASVLQRHWPGVPNHGDITTIDFAAVEPVDLLCGGFPCQDVSVANTRGKGLDGEHSGLWREYARAVRELRPRWVVIENVPRLLRRGFAVVRSDLRAAGYRLARPVLLSASALGAPHIRERLWLVAHADGLERRLQPGRWQRPRSPEAVQPAHDGTTGVTADTYGLRQLESQGSVTDERGWPSDRHGWTTKPGVSGVDDGLPQRVDRERCLGNSIVPQCALVILRQIAEAEMSPNGETREEHPPMSRASDFHVGQRVRLTDRAVRQGLQGYAKTRMGTVRRVGPNIGIEVQRDGLKGIDGYHCAFWEPTDE